MRIKYKRQYCQVISGRKSVASNGAWPAHRSLPWPSNSRLLGKMRVPGKDQSLCPGHPQNSHCDCTLVDLGCERWQPFSHTGDLMVVLIFQIPYLEPLGSPASCTILTILAKASTDKIVLFSDRGIVFQEEWWPRKVPSPTMSTFGHFFYQREKL